MKEFLKHLIENNHTLFARICEFNFLPLRYINRERLRAILPEVKIDIFSSLEKSEKAFSKLILKRLGLEKEYFFAFDSLFRRVALLKEKKLLKLIFFCGAALQRLRIVRLITKSERMAFEKKFGSDVYLFALKRAPLLIGKDIKEIPQTEDLYADIVKSGIWCLEVCFANEPSSLTERLKLKLPLGFECNFKKDIEKKFQMQIQNFMGKLLRHEVREQWLFTN
jgi:hypothetical protein